jgi:DNA-binding MarR family transcriptional regulator
MKRDGGWLDILKETIVGLARSDARTLTARQLAVLLICGLDDSPHTVRGLAERLNTPKPTITRSVDKLAYLALLRREPDPTDRRSVLLVATASGRAYVQELRAMMAAAGRHASEKAAGPAEAG